MKNKYLKGAHLSERKVRDLMKLFCEDLTATQIANITGISRITVNAYFKLIRTHIAGFCEEKNPLHYSNGSSLLSLKDDNGTATASESGVKKSFYGIFRNNSFLYTQKIPSVNAPWIYDWVKGKTVPEPTQVQQHHLNVFNGIADFNAIKLYRISDSVLDTARGKSQIDEIDMFWGMLKSRLIKFRGLNGGTLYLHVKETEFRYNYRDMDLYEIIMDVLLKRPLHYSRA